MRKYNKIISCSRTETGSWRVIVQTPHNQFHTRLYMGFPKKAVLHAARITDFDLEAGLIFNKPPSKKRER